MNAFGYVLEGIAVWMFISAVRHANRRDFLDDHGTEKGKAYAATLGAVAVGVRVAFGIVLLLVGLWMLGAFR